MDTRRTQIERSSDSRRRLIESAIDLLATRGYAGTSLAAIGTQAGLSRGLVTHHFGTKEQCVAEVVTHIRHAVESELAEAGDLHGLEAVQNLLRTYLSPDTRFGRSSRAMYVIMIHAATSAPDLLPALNDNNYFVRQMVAGWLDEAAELGEIDPSADTAKLSLVITGIMRGIKIQLMMNEHADDVAATAAAVEFVEASLRIASPS